MELAIVRRIRGNVLGSIDVTALEDKVLAHPYVQRLRRIRQLAFLSFVFPGATHSRFEHSLGVLQLAGVTWDKMRSNQARLAASCLRYREFEGIEKRGIGGMVHGLLAPTFAVMEEVFASDYTLQALRLAGFLHDLGHPPFSHSGERFLPTWQQLLSSIKDVPVYLLEYLQRRCDNLADQGRDPYKTPVKHEVYTLLLVDKLLNEVYREHKKLALTIAPRDVLSIMTPEITPVAGSVLHKHGVYKLCNELISGEVDIDRMDYLVRDSKECGVVYGIFDAPRIQDSLTVYHDPLDSCLHLAINFSGLAAFEDYLRARHSMYLQLYFHKTSVAAEAMIQHLARLLGGYTLPVDINVYAELDEYSIEAELLSAAAALQDVERRRQVEKTLRDLLRNRRLWKRVYEVSEGDLDTAKENLPKKLEQACKLIKDMGIPYEQISSSTSLTSFRPRKEDELSRNYLRLIKKDETQFPRVVPIEDHSSLIAGNNTVNISRIYVEDNVDSAGESVPWRVKQELNDKLRAPR